MEVLVAELARLQHGVVSRAQLLERGMSAAEIRSELRGLLARHPGRPGTPSLGAVVRGATPAWTRSKAEAMLLALIRSADLPLPESNQRLGRYQPDLLWREHRLIVEEPHAVVARIAAALALASG